MTVVIGKATKTKSSSIFYDWLVIIALALFVLGFYIRINNDVYKLLIFLIFAVLGFGLTYISRALREKRKEIARPPLNPTLPLKERDDRRLKQHDVKQYFESPQVVLGTMYAVLAGFAFTEALKGYYLDHVAQFAGTLHLTPWILYSSIWKNADSVFRLMAFFAIAIPFYHGGLLSLLKGKAVEKDERQTLLIFIMIFFHGSIIYFMGANIDDIYIFASLVLTLMITDISWLFYMTYSLKDDTFPMEWVQLNTITAVFFALFFSLTFSQAHMMIISITFVVVLGLRTILDYAFGWEPLYGLGLRRPRRSG